MKIGVHIFPTKGEMAGFPNGSPLTKGEMGEQRRTKFCAKQANRGNPEYRPPYAHTAKRGEQSHARICAAAAVKIFPEETSKTRREGQTTVQKLAKKNNFRLGAESNRTSENIKKKSVYPKSQIGARIIPTRAALYLSKAHRI